MHATRAAAQQATIDGVVDRVWVDQPGQATQPVYFLTTATGAHYNLLIGGFVAPGFGDRGRHWRVTGVLPASIAAPGSTTAATLTVASAAPRSGPALTSAATSIRYATILCQMPTRPAATPNDIQAWQAMQVNTYPGLGHWFNQISGGLFTYISAGVVAATVGGDFADYFPDGTGSGALPALSTVLDRCIAAATNIDWNGVDGINIRYTGGSGTSYGGTQTTMLGGQLRTVGVTWLDGGDIGVLTHEVGHTLGWQHSGPPGNDYGSPWDIMSGGPYFPLACSCPPWVGQSAIFTITPNRVAMGWIPPSRQTVIQAGSEQVVSLTAPFIGVVPTAGSVDYVELTTASGSRIVVEARRAGVPAYDFGLPYSAVLLHKYDRAGSARFLATATFPNLDALDPQPGPLYQSPEGFRVELLSTTSDGYSVRITNGWRLTAAVQGNGAIIGLPGGVCTSTCTAISSPQLHTVVLNPRQSPGDAPFMGWTGACGGTGSCTVALDAIKSVTAVFGSQISLLVGSERPYGVVGTGYSDMLVAVGPGIMSWRLASGTIPPGLNLNTATGAVVGVPSAAGQYQFTITLTAGNASTSQTFTARMVDPLSILPSGSGYLVSGRPSRLTLLTHGGGGPATWALISYWLLPSELSFGSDGGITGTPAAIHLLNLNVRARWDTLVTTSTVAVSVVGPPYVASGPVLSPATIGNPYYYTLSVAESVGPITWSLKSGALPAGITLQPNGILVGVPETNGNSTFTVQTQADVITDTATLSLAVNTPVIDARAVITALLHQSGVPYAQAQYFDYIGNRNGGFDIGDVRAWLMQQRIATGTASVGDLIRALRTMAARTLR